MSTEKPANKRFLTIEQVAEELIVGAPQIRALLRTGELKGIQVGGRRLWRIGVDDVDEYVADAYRRTAARIASGEM